MAYKTTEDYVGTTVVAHRSNKHYAEKMIADFSDTLGDQNAWNGHNLVPIHIEWAAIKSPSGGYDIVATTTAREA
jgi:hypothetical protein